MKKFIFMFLVAFSATSSCLAEESKLETGDWFMKIRTAKLVRFLNLNSSQYDKVEVAMDYFSEKMQDAVTARNEKAIKYLNEAVLGNLKLMKNTLDDNQYRKYLQLMNVELKNNGLNGYIK